MLPNFDFYLKTSFELFLLFLFFLRLMEEQKVKYIQLLFFWLCQNGKCCLSHLLLVEKKFNLLKI